MAGVQRARRHADVTQSERANSNSLQLQQTLWLAEAAGLRAFRRFLHRRFPSSSPLASSSVGGSYRLAGIG